MFSFLIFTRKSPDSARNQRISFRDELPLHFEQANLHRMLLPVGPDKAINAEYARRQFELKHMVVVQIHSKVRHNTVALQELQLGARIHFKNLQDQIVAGEIALHILPHSPPIIRHRLLSQFLFGRPCLTAVLIVR